MKSPPNQQCHHDLKGLLTRQTEELDDINVYLDEIRMAIAEDDTKSVADLLDQQRLPSRALSDLETQRQQLLQSFGFKLDREGLQQCISWCDSESIIAMQYELFRQALMRLQHAILVNSSLINKGRERVRKGLQLLVGEPNSDQYTTYSRNGKEGANNNGRTIVRV